MTELFYVLFADIRIYPTGVDIPEVLFKCKALGRIYFRCRCGSDSGVATPPLWQSTCCRSGDNRTWRGLVRPPRHVSGSGTRGSTCR